MLKNGYEPITKQGSGKYNANLKEKGDWAHVPTPEYINK